MNCKKPSLLPARLFVAALLFLAGPALLAGPDGRPGGRLTVGEVLPTLNETEHPYATYETETAELVWQQEIHHPGAKYISPYITKMDLAPGDFLIVRSPDGSRSSRYTGYGRKDLGKGPGFWALHIPGDTAILELYSYGSAAAYGVTIEKYARGYTHDEIHEFNEDFERALCGDDDSQEAKCLSGDEPEMYESSRAVARLFTNGIYWCTGWLIGDENHLMTNQHCIENQSWADNSTVEMMAEGDTCETNCASGGACAGTVLAEAVDLVQVNEPLDYALVKLPESAGDAAGTYGFLQLRASGPELGERIYIPQHPAGWGKRIANASTHPQDADGLTYVFSVTEAPCNAGAPPEVGYWTDTQGGSSGSPVLGYSDHRVIALHHCRGSALNCGDPNRGVTIDAVIADLGSNLPPSAVCPTVAGPTSLNAENTADNQVSLSWPALDGENMRYNLYRGLGTCDLREMTQLAASLETTSYVDNEVSGTLTYNYAVVGFLDGCETLASPCIEVTPTGVCQEQPTFAGLESIANVGEETCAVQLSWRAGSGFCGQSIRYNVYRGEVEDFVPGPVNRVASCLTTTDYLDVDVLNGQTYYYIVRAEDGDSVGDGNCGGREETNVIVQSLAVTGAEVNSFQDTLTDNADNFMEMTGDADSGTTGWSHSREDGNLHCPSAETVQDQSIAFVRGYDLPDAARLFLSFMHRYDFEASWDGGVLEYSLDGSHWADILEGTEDVPANADRFLISGYDVTLRDSVNPISGRQAFNGNSGSEMHQTRVDLTDFAGKTIWFRWRAGADGSVNRTGWWLDDIVLSHTADCQNDSVPDFNYDMWHNSDRYHGHYDTDGNGMIDVLDLVDRLNQLANAR
ncbi:Trypsin-like peptidase domain-containing protein [Sulfidibacter corallicola]|uniref:Trypsin-like peptidase domain-containing protein n=1 Tax=Sulfidibacter corallicola TaxID=2818388 RepID=A0A8A4TFC9_SULCO|nr:trypsin-like peptidase domain-containing protein [Sulfidibacter corallicola]QTD47914.1 trypsin-like peptidase domain-containing protein [Sulfidibacter corallicola]